MFIIVKTIATILIILGITEISGKFPKLAGFLASMPIISLLIVIFSHIQYGNNFDMIKFYKGMLVGLPTLIVFYSPFLFIKNFYLCLLLGFVFLTIIFFTYKHFGLV